MSNTRFNRPVDTDLKFMASAALTPGGDGSTADATGVAVTSIAGGDGVVEAIFNVSAAAGTIDASNYIEVEVQVSADDATYYAVSESRVKVLETGAIVVAIERKSIDELVADVTHFRVTATQTGTTATAVTLDAYFSPAK